MTTLSRLLFLNLSHSVLRAIVLSLSLLLAAWVIATAPLPPLLIGIGGLMTFFFLLRWPWLIWLGIGAGLPVTSGIKLGPLSLTEVAVAVAVALWLADGVRHRSLKVQKSPVVVALAFYIAALYLALLGATDLGEAVREVVKWLEVLVVLLVLREMLPPSQAKWLVAALLAGGVGQALLGLYQFIYRIGPDWFVILGRFMRASGSFGQPNPYAGYLGVTLPVAVSLALWAWAKGVRSARPRGRPGMRHGASHTRRWNYLAWAMGYTVAAGLIGAGLVASWSRGGWLGAVAGVGVVVVMRSRAAALVSLLVLLLVLTAFLVGSFSPALVPEAISTRLRDIPTFLGLTDVLSQPVTDENFSVVERLAHWVAALRMWEGSLWLGVGPGNYAVIYPEVRLPRWQEALGHAHNIYLNVLAESGLVGFLFFCLLWIVIIAQVGRHWRQATRRNEGWQAALAVGVLGVITHLNIHNFFDNLFVQGIYLQIALWIALLQSHFTPA